MFKFLIFFLFWGLSSLNIYGGVFNVSTSNANAVINVGGPYSVSGGKLRADVNWSITISSPAVRDQWSDSYSASLDFYPFSGPMMTRTSGQLSSEVPVGNSSFTQSGSGYFEFSNTVTVDQISSVTLQAVQQDRTYKFDRVNVIIPFRPNSQTISANALTGTGFKNSPITGAATGKAEGSSYRMTITSSSGGGSINSETGQYVLNPSATGHLTFQIYAIASPGNLESNILNGDYFINESNKFKYSIPFNDGKFPLRYELWQSGIMVGSTIVQPGQGGTIATIDLGANSGGVEMRSFVLGVMSDGINTIIEKGSETLQQVKSYTPQQVETPTIQPLNLPPLSSLNASVPNSISESTSTVWSKPTAISTQSNTVAGEGDGLSNQIYREGVGKLLDKLDQIEVNKSKDKANSQTLSVAAHDASISSGAAAASSASSKIPNPGSFPSALTVSSSAQNWTIQFPAMFGGSVFDLDPLRADRLGPVASWCRSAFYWLTIVSFGYWASTRVGEWVKGASQLQQTRGNTVAGTGGQVTAAIGAAIIVVTVSTFIVALVGYLAGEFSLASILSKISANPTAGMGAKALYLLDGLFPVATIITALVGRVSWNLYASSTFAGAAAAIRFVNP